MESPWLQFQYHQLTNSSRTTSTAWKVWLSAWLAKISASEFYLRVQCIQICQPDSKECKLMSAPTLCIEKGLIEKNKPGTGSTNDKPTFLVKNPRETMPNSSKSCNIFHITLGVPGSVDWPLRNAIGHWRCCFTTSFKDQIGKLQERHSQTFGHQKKSMTWDSNVVWSSSVSQSTFLPCLFGTTTTNDKANPASMKITSKYPHLHKKI